MQTEALTKTTFEITKMDCPSEENLIRMKLEHVLEISHLEFDIPSRKLLVFHREGLPKIEQNLAELDLGARKVETEKNSAYGPISETEKNNQRRSLWFVLGINLLFFIIEMTTGLVSKSMGLVADSLDMLADSLVYGLSLMAVGASVLMKKRVARLAGYFQIALAVIGLFEVLRRFISPKLMPDFKWMMIVSFFALLANILSLYILQKSKSKEAHMQASMIFTSNDILINIGVMVAGALVYWLESSIPDLLIGTLVFFLVLRGAQRILKLSK